ncbi:MAG TPA: glucosamine-6-phosphate deaminase [Candidatus Merdenecus merdavium]|nr:glucosamine-6-phosphate deaminase [Candidatus Merdenecus merdavium]
MRIIKTNDVTEMSRKAANIISAQIILNPKSVLGLATGGSPIGTYKELIQRYKTGDLDFSTITSVNLDEYKGLSGDNNQSYRYFMNHNLFHHVNIHLENTFVPNGTIEDATKACSDFERKIEVVGGIDLQLLGLGHNGHIGFNEPSDSFSKETHCVELTQSTIDANTRFFEKSEDVPKQAYTMGIGTIMKARKILVIVSGEAKADILAQVIQGPITPHVPASILQLHHDVTIIADAAALSKVTL